MRKIGVYEVSFDDSTNQFVMHDQIGQRGEQRRDTVADIASLIEMDIFETDMAQLDDIADRER